MPQPEQQTIPMPWGICTYTVKHSTRRTIGLRLDPMGIIHLSAPLRTPQHILEDILRQKAAWIERSIQRQRLRQMHNTTLEERLASQQAIPIIGHPYTVHHHSGKIAILNPHTHTITLPKGTPTEQIKALETLLKQHAIQTFNTIAQQLAHQHQLPAFQIHLSSPKARWGSCDQAGNIRINWRLIHHALPRIQYVIAHELSHLLEMNHSPRFWAWVEQLMPNFKEIEVEFQTFSPGLVPHDQPLLA